MKLLLTDENSDPITENDVPLHMSSIRECFLEEMFTKAGENQSYFLIYLDTSETWIQTKIPFNYEQRNGKIVPVYEERLVSYELHLNGEETACELTEDEQLMLASVCVRVLLEDFVYGAEWVIKTS